MYKSVYGEQNRAYHQQREARCERERARAKILWSIKMSLKGADHDVHKIYITQTGTKEAKKKQKKDDALCFYLYYNHRLDI